jgi:hypothetical protein
MQKKMQESSTPSERSPVCISEIPSISTTEAAKATTPISSPQTPVSKKSSETLTSANSPSPKLPKLELLELKEPISERNAKNTAAPEEVRTPTISVTDANDDAASCSTPVTKTPENSPGSSGGKKGRKRCRECNKKVGLLGFACKCEGLFCSIHRYSDKHGCDYDYKSPGAEQIRKSNPTVVAEKVKKI